MPKIILINDPHICSKAPTNRNDNYCQDIFDKLEVISKITQEEKIDCVMIAGDLFHQPNSNRVSHELVNQLMKIFGGFNTQIVAVPGNHDLHSLVDLPKQPIFTLTKLPNFVLLHSGQRFITDSGIDICGIEWDYSSNTKFIKDRVGDKKPDIILTHAAIDNKLSGFFDVILKKDIAGLSKFVAAGHLHFQMPIEIINGTTFLNPGALSRGSLSSDDLTRKPSIAVIDTTGKSTYQVIPHKNVQDIFLLESAFIKRNSENQSVINFVNNLSLSDGGIITVEELINQSKKFSNDPKILSMVEEILLGVK